MAFDVHLDSDRCQGCEECLEACSVGVFELNRGRCVPVRPNECLGCGACVDTCRARAITITGLEPSLSDTARLLLREIL